VNAAEAANIDMFECIVLSALMNDSANLPVCSDDFSGDAKAPNRIIFDRLQGMSNRGLLAVCAELRRTNELEKVGGEHRVTEIFLMNPDAQNVEYALANVLEYSRARQAAKIGERLHKGEIDFPGALEQLNTLNRDHDNGLPPIQDAAELVRQPLILPEDIIEGILHRGAKMVLGGGSKTFKTWILVDLATSVATGTTWLGKFPTKRGRVLYINLELQGAFFTNRIKTVSDENQITLTDGYLRVWNLRGYACDLSTLLPRVLRGIGRDEFVLIIIDPVYKLLGLRDENKAGDIASLLNQIEALAVETGAAVAFGAHYSKGNQAAKEPIDRVGGSGVFARDPDSILNFTRHEQEDCFTVDATLRNHPPIKPFVVKWEYPLMTVDSLLDPDHLKQAGAAVKQYLSSDLLDLLDRPMETAEFKDTAKTETGMSERTFYRLYGELKESGTITLDAKGKWNRK
jgi:hypothetical protein